MHTFFPFKGRVGQHADMIRAARKIEIKVDSDDDKDFQSGHRKYLKKSDIRNNRQIPVVNKTRV